MKRVVVAGAGGFIGGHLVKSLIAKGYQVRGVDKKPLNQWYQVTEKAENLVLDLTIRENCYQAVNGYHEVFNLAADMGGMGFIETHRVDCLRSILINTHLVEAAYRAGAKRYFYASSACAYNTDLQTKADVVALKESDAFPAMAERGYGWEKLISEMFCQEYWAERSMPTFVARFHNVYGPHGTWDGGREKAPAAIARKVIEAKLSKSGAIDIWGAGTRTRSFLYIDDCVKGIDLITHCDGLVATPINLGSSELIEINRLVDIAEKIGGVKLQRSYKLDAPKGVAGRNSDNTFIKKVLGWEPSIGFAEGLEKTYRWIETQVRDRAAGKRTIE